MGIGKGENKTTWDDFLKSQQGSQAKKGSNKVSGSGASGKRSSQGITHELRHC